MKWFLQRLSEPSGYAGIGIAATSIQSLTHGGDANVAIGGILAGLLAFLVPEKKSEAGSAAVR